MEFFELIQHEVHAANGKSTVLIGESLKNLKKYLNKKNNVVITDNNVRHFHGDSFSDFEIIEIGTGESIKTLNTVEEIYKRFLDLEMDRNSFVIGIGGGIVLDIAGFAASTFMRGLDFGYVPSTLLAQADAGIGGKTGVNLYGYKNIVGVFSQPRFVLCDTDLLKTLPEQELLCGISEVIKHALIKSSSLFDFLERNCSSLLSLQQKTVQKAVYDSIMIKSRIVETDTLEKGERKKLNFGHTLGHAIEKVSPTPHGLAVSMGMVMATRMSVARGMLSSEEAGRIEKLLLNYGLPVQLPNNSDALLEAIKKDKKRVGKEIDFVFLQEIEKAEVIKISYQELETQIKDLTDRADL